MFSIIFSSLLSDKISRSCQCHVTTTLVTTRTHRDDDTLLVTDDDECALGTHNCGQTRECRNTPGSFRCINKRCPPGYRLNYRSGQCEEVQCGQGMKADHSGSCVGKSGESWKGGGGGWLPNCQGLGYVSWRGVSLVKKTGLPKHWFL